MTYLAAKSNEKLKLEEILDVGFSA
jgi:hypothetical protein